MWRDGRLLVVSKDVQLPDRCIKCNAPAGGLKVKRRLSWHHPALYFVILAGLLIYIVVALIVRQTAIVRVGMCRQHIARRHNAITIGWLLFLAGIASLVAAGVFSESAWFLLALWGGIALIVAGLVYGITRSQVVTPKRIDAHYAWLQGVCPEYLEELPPAQGAR